MFRQTIFAAAAFALFSGIAAADPRPERVILDTAQTIAVQQTVDAEPLLAAMDFDRVARFTLGKYARRISDSEFEDFKLAFRDTVRRAYAQHFSDFALSELNIVDTRARGDNEAIIRSSILRKDGERVDLKWRLMKTGGDWRVIDVEVYGLWLAIEQRAQFAAILDRPGATIDTLITELRRG